MEGARIKFEVWTDYENLEYFIVMICLGQAFWHQGMPAVIDGRPWELVVIPLGRCKDVHLIWERLCDGHTWTYNRVNS